MFLANKTTEDYLAVEIQLQFGVVHRADHALIAMFVRFLHLVLILEVTFKTFFGDIHCSCNISFFFT